MTINDIINMDIDTLNKLNVKELKGLTSQLASAGNKRLKRFESKDIITPATREISKSGGKFTVKDKNLNALRAEFVRAKNFLQSKTGTVRGWNKVKKKTINELKENGVDLTDAQFDNFWKSYDDLKELDPSVANEKLRYGVLREISDMVDDDTDPKEVALKILPKITKIYENRAELENNDRGVSEYFKL